MYKQTVSIIVATITATIPSIAYGVPCQQINRKTNDISHIFPSCGVELLAQTREATSSELDELLRRGRELVDAGNYQLAITIYQQAARLDPKNAQISGQNEYSFPHSRKTFDGFHF